MSKTIEERAVRLGCIAKENSLLKNDACNEELREFWNNVSLSQQNGVSFRGIPEYVSEACCQAYIKGATDQREIDIEKACEWLKHGGYFVNNTETLEDFKKAMEEE